MKPTVLLLALVAVTVSGQEPVKERDAIIVRSDVIRHGANAYTSEQELSNKISQSSSGTSIPGPEPETGSIIMRGQYSYIAPDGQNITVTWYADETGFHPTSDAIPVNVEPLVG